MSVTTAVWYGPPAARCSLYPRADVFFHPPVGFVGSTPSTATLTTNGATAGDCPAQTSIEAGVWVRYRLGAELP